MSNLSTREEAIYRLIVEPIEATGEIDDAHAAFDIEAIADEVLAFDEAFDEDRDAYLLDKQGWNLASQYRNDVDEDGMQFWAVVERQALSQES